MSDKPCPKPTPTPTPKPTDNGGATTQGGANGSTRPPGT